jgi:hypothetical protein
MRDTLEAERIGAALDLNDLRLRLRGPLARPGRCPPCVRNYCYAAAHHETWRDKENGPPGRVSAASRPFLQVVAGPGFEPGRRSRRFYSPSLLPESPAADLRLCVSRRDFGPPPSAMRPWAPGSGGRGIHGRARTATMGAVMPTVSASFLPLICLSRLPASCSSLQIRTPHRASLIACRRAPTCELIASADRENRSAGRQDPPASPDTEGPCVMAAAATTGCS